MTRGSTVAVALALALALPAQVDAAAVAKGVAAYRAGDHATAFAAFREQAERAGGQVPPELRWNLALAALRVQRSGDAEAAVAPWLRADDAHERAGAEFVGAMAAFQRAERAAAAARLQDAEPLAWAMALQAMERSVAQFVEAATTRGGWPQAERNAQRARERLAALQRERDAAAGSKPRTERPDPPPPPAPAAQPEAAAVDRASVPLTAAEIARMRARVAQRERAKTALRRAQQRAAVAAGERAW
jgi:hypothetical protein